TFSSSPEYTPPPGAGCTRAVRPGWHLYRGVEESKETAPGLRGNRAGVSWHTTLLAKSRCVMPCPLRRAKADLRKAHTSWPNSRLRLLYLCEVEGNENRFYASCSSDCKPAFLPSAKQRYITLVFRSDISSYLAFCQNFQHVLLRPAEIALLS